MSQPEISESGGCLERDKTIKTLSNTIATLYEGDLKELNNKLNEFTGRQEQLQKEIEIEKEFFTKEENWKDAQNLMTSIQVYKDKLVAIKKEMGNIHMRTKNLKRRATEIQEFKLKQLNNPK